MTKDAYLKEVKLDDAEKANKQFLSKRNLGLAAVALALTASNLESVERWRHLADQGDMITSPPGCEIEYAPDTEEHVQARAIIETEVNGVRSAGWNFLASQNLNSVAAIAADLPGALSQHLEYMIANRGERFTMVQSGIEIMIHSPVEVEVDRELFAEVFHAPLTLDEEYSHPEVRQMMACYRQYIMEDKKAAGETYHVLVAPPGYCIDNFQFKPVDEIEKCFSRGATPPKFQLNFLGISVVDYQIMMLSTGRIETSANQELAENTKHEPAHTPMTLLGQIFRLNPDERFSKHVESVVEEHLYPNGAPIAIRYLETNH